MRKTIRRIVCMTAAILVLLSLAPAPVRAVDPVSAATMANALAQAITAYGASNGVSMMYDVTDTNGIGEGVHDLWDQFKADINDNDVPTYDSLAVATWSTIYKKVGNSVAINLSDTTVSYLDRFWNWLLSGPAEMQKVDNQYYEWSVVDGSVAPIPVISTIDPSINGYSLVSLPIYRGSDDGSLSNTYTASVNSVFCLPLYNASNNYKYMVMINLTNQNFQYYENDGAKPYWASSSRGWYYVSVAASSGMYFDYDGTYYPTINSATTPYDYFGSYESENIEISESGINIRPYVGDTTPQDVYIPDNDDVNYQPLPYVGPLNIPWQNAWGDGETIDDAGAKDIADALDQQIVDDGTLQLEGDNTVNPPIDDVIGGPNDYQVPGLADVFPFCIPFDIYNFLSALAADPVAPHFTAQLDFPEAIGGTQTIDIDFDSPTWNQLAQLLRLLELLAFIVGLALLTRSMFIRG